MRYAIAMLEIDAEHIENQPARAALLAVDGEPPAPMSARDKQQLKECRAAAEWLRDLVAGYQNRRGEPEHESALTAEA